MSRSLPVRNGMTMYEVVLSLAILMGSMAVLGQLISTGSRAATQSRLRTQAMLLCQTKMAEVIAGSVLMQAVNDDVLESTATGDWVWSLQVVGGASQGGGLTSGDSAAVSANQTAAAPHADLVRLDVSVSRITRDKTVAVTQTLTRFIRNPQLYVEAAERAAELAAEAEAAGTTE
jgi:hypothetical protein